MKFISFLLSIVVFVFTQGCKSPSAKDTSPPDNGEELIETINLGEKKLLIEYGENRIPQNISPLDADLLKEGYAFEYRNNGELKKISHWKKGVRQGATWVFEQGVVQSHLIFDRGELVYRGDYSNQVKVENQLYPHFMEEFFFEDKYYAKISFPTAYQGQLQVAIKDFPAVISPLPQQTFQLVINDALDLSKYTLSVCYHPVTQDTLVKSEYLYTHVVFSD